MQRFAFPTSSAMLSGCAILRVRVRVRQLLLCFLTYLLQSQPMSCLSTSTRSPNPNPTDPALKLTSARNITKALGAQLHGA